MTKVEFRDGIKEMLEDMADPDGDFADMTNNFKQLSTELSEHDPVLADKFMDVSRSINDLGDYVRARAEKG